MGKPRQLQKLGGEIDRVMATAGSIAEAARMLGIDRSSLTRWISAGKVAKPRRQRLRSRTAPIGANSDAIPLPAPPAPAEKPGAADAPSDELPGDDWAQTVRDDYDLDATGLQLVAMADAARLIALDNREPAAVRLAAMARFSQLVKHLDLEPKDNAHGQTETTPPQPRQFPRRVV